MAVDSKCPSQALCSCCPSTGISVLSMLTTTRWGWGPPRPPPRSQFLIDSPQTFQIPAWLAPQSRTNADAKATLPAIQIFSEPINRNLARDRQEYFRPGMEIGRSSLPSGRTLALYICTRVSSIGQRQHRDSRIFYFWPAELNRWHWSWLLHGLPSSENGNWSPGFGLFGAILVDVAQ